MQDLRWKSLTGYYKNKIEFNSKLHKNITIIPLLLLLTNISIVIPAYNEESIHYLALGYSGSGVTLK